MIKRIKNFSIFKKTVLFTSCIIMVVGFATAVISYQIQSNAITQILSDQAVSVANLWKTTIPSQDIIAAKNAANVDDPSVEKLTYLIDKIHEKNSVYSQGYIFTSEIPENRAFDPIAVPFSLVRQGFGYSDLYVAGDEFFSAFEHTVLNKTSTYTDIYTDQYGTWISAFSPIFAENGEVIAVFGVDIDASILNDFQLDLMMSLLISCIVLFTVFFIIQEWGLRKVMAPLRGLFQGIHQVSQGNFDVKLVQTDDSELGELSKMFNDMTRQLHTLFERVAVTSEQFGDNSQQRQELQGFEKALGDMENIIKQSKLQTELQRAERMNAIGQLAASVAHEIRNPMTVVKGFLQIFESKESMTKEEIEYIQLMIAEMNRAETIINDYLSLAKPDLEKSEVINCSEALQNVTDLISSYALLNNNISINMEIKGTYYIKGNNSELKQVLLNIMKNAVEAMKKEGVLTAGLFCENKYVHFIIKDTGIGMTTDELKRLGTPFYSLKEKGTGIGLMVCYQIVDRMRGKIKVESEKGKGTIFTISIPLYES